MEGQFTNEPKIGKTRLLPGDTLDWQAVYEEIDALTGATRKEIPHHLDIPYSRNRVDPKQRLDIYAPDSASNCPVFFFLHGGAFREGDRAHYGYVARPMAKKGILTVVASYRLAPRYFYPDQAEDVEAALAWVFENIASFGGNPARVYVSGHSAGGILAAFVSFKRDWLQRFSLPEDYIKGCAPISSPYDLIYAGDRLEHYVPDRGMRKEASPFYNVENIPPWTVISVGSGEYDQFARGRLSFEMAEKLKTLGAQVDFLVLEGLDHAGTVLSLANEQSVLFQTILRRMTD